MVLSYIVPKGMDVIRTKYEWKAKINLDKCQIYFLSFYIYIFDLQKF